MKKMCSFIAVLLLSSMLPAHATDNMKAFPQRIRARFDMSYNFRHKMTNPLSK